MPAALAETRCTEVVVFEQFKKKKKLQHYGGGLSTKLNDQAASGWMKLANWISREAGWGMFGREVWAACLGTGLCSGQL